MLLNVSRASAGYGEVSVLHAVDLSVDDGEMVALVGSNGAGKTTLLKTVAGLLPTTSGEIVFAGQQVQGLKAYERIRRGITLVPEGRRLFQGMTVKQNLLMGAQLSNDRKAVNARLEETIDLFPRLRERLGQTAGSLSGGEQQMCAIGRGLMANPRLLMIDELSLGLAPVAVDLLFEVLRQVHERGVSLLLVEQDVQVALSNADRAYVLETGRITLSGPSQDLAENPSIKAAYLGL